MSNVLEFKVASSKQSLKSKLLDDFDAQFSVLSTNQQRDLLKRIKVHFLKLNVNFFYSSKMADYPWVKEFKPLLYLDKNIGFSFNVAKTLKLEDGWIIYPLEATTCDDFMLVVNHIATIIQMRENENE